MHAAGYDAETQDEPAGEAYDIGCGDGAAIEPGKGVYLADGGDGDAEPQHADHGGGQHLGGEQDLHPARGGGVVGCGGDKKRDEQGFSRKAHEVPFLEGPRGAQQQRLILDEIVDQQHQREPAGQRREQEQPDDGPAAPEGDADIAEQKHSGVRHGGNGENAGEDFDDAHRLSPEDACAKHSGGHEQEAQDRLDGKEDRAESEDGGVWAQQDEQHALGAAQIPEQEQDRQDEQRQAERVDARLQRGECLEETLLLREGRCGFSSEKRTR